MTEPSLSNLPADIFTESLLSLIAQEEHQEEEGAAAEHEQERLQQPAAARGSSALLGELRALWRRGILLGVGRHLGRRLPRRRLQEPDGGSRQAAGR